MKKVLAVGCLLSVSILRAIVVDDSWLLHGSMKNFVQSFVPAAEQSSFVNYYQEFLKLFAQENGKKQEATRSALYEKAMKYLQSHDATMHEFVVGRIKQLRAPNINKNEIENVERFLTRVGVYADFVVLRAQSGGLVQLRAFADDSFEGFLRRVVASGDRIAFTRYYERLSEKLHTCSEERKLVTYKYLFDKAMSDLETHHADWHAALMRYSSPEGLHGDVVAAKARLFLRRYGAYQEYLELTGQLHNGIFASIETFCSTIGQTISGWFGFSRA